MPYRTAPPREPDLLTEAPRVIEIHRYGWIWTAAMVAIAAAMCAIGLVTYERSVLSCSRPAAGAPASCSLITEGVFKTKRDSLHPSSSVQVQDAMMGDSTGPHLRVDVSSGVRWFQLDARNETVAAAHRAFLASPEPGRFEEELDAQTLSASLLPLFGLLMLAMVLVLEVKQRIAIFVEAGEVHVTKKSLLGGSREQRYKLAEIDAIDTEQEGDGEIYAVVLVRAGQRERVVTGSATKTSDVARELEAVKKAHLELVAEREATERRRREAHVRATRSQREEQPREKQPREEQPPEKQGSKKRGRRQPR